MWVEQNVHFQLTILCLTWRKTERTFILKLESRSFRLVIELQAFWVACLRCGNRGPNGGPYPWTCMKAAAHMAVNIGPIPTRRGGLSREKFFDWQLCLANHERGMLMRFTSIMASPLASPLETPSLSSRPFAPPATTLFSQFSPKTKANF